LAEAAGVVLDVAPLTDAPGAQPCLEAGMLGAQEIQSVVTGGGLAFDDAFQD
jgi:hypothetical protein